MSAATVRDDMRQARQRKLCLPLTESRNAVTLVTDRSGTVAQAGRRVLLSLATGRPERLGGSQYGRRLQVPVRRHSVCLVLVTVRGVRSARLHASLLTRGEF